MRCAFLVTVIVVLVCFATLHHANAQLVVRLHNLDECETPESLLSHMFSRQQLGNQYGMYSAARVPTYSYATFAPALGSPVPAFASVPVPNETRAVASAAYPWTNRGAATPGMFTCTRNGVVSKIGAVGCPEGFAGTFIVRAEPYFVPQRPEYMPADVDFVKDALVPNFDHAR